MCLTEGFKMKIAVVSSNEEKNGVGIYARKLFLELKKSNKDINFESILPNESPLYYYLRGKSVAKKNYNLINVQFDYPLFGKLGVSGVYAPLFYLGLGLKIPIISTFHDFTIFKGPTSLIFNTARKAINKFVYLYSDRVVVPDSYSKNNLVRMGVSKEKLEEIPLGAFFTRTEVKNAKKILQLRGKKIISIFGFVSKHKDYKTVFKTLKSLGKKYHLIIAGGSMNKDNTFIDELKTEINNEKLENQVTITGFIQEKDFPTYLSATDICILPYKSMVASSAVLNQLMSFEKIVITTKLPSLVEIENDYNCIKTYKDEQELKNIIINISKHNKNLKKGINKYKKEFAFQAICKRYNNLFSKTIENNLKKRN